MSALALMASSVMVNPTSPRAIGLRKDGVGLAIHFLQQKVEALAGFPARVGQLGELRGMDFQAGDFLAHVGPVGQHRRLLGEPLRFDGRALQQFRQPVLQSRLVELDGSRAQGFDALGRVRHARVVVADQRRQLRAFPFAELGEGVQRFDERRHHGSFVFRREARNLCVG